MAGNGLDDGRRAEGDVKNGRELGLWVWNSETPGCFRRRESGRELRFWFLQPLIVIELWPFLSGATISRQWANATVGVNAIEG